jgi:HD-GYP domain-containing protein (c-di-GMP phosphodiesterase class II)
MNKFQKRTATQITLVSILLASIASPLAWFVSKEHEEESIVALASEESGKLLKFYHAVDLSTPAAHENAKAAAKTLVGGLFDISEIYDQNGKKVAEELTADGERIENSLPHHVAPAYTIGSYESIKLLSGEWVLRVFIPLRATENEVGPITGYFEGVRVVPAWQEAQIFTIALSTALMVCLASLLCGAAIYPVVVHLSNDNQRKAREVLDSHLSMMEALGRSIAKRDSDTGVHNYRVAWIATQIAEAIDIPQAKMQSLIIGSFLHDVGKIGIPDAILLKPGKLTDDEMDIMRTHVDQGEQILRGIGWLDSASEIVASHHEKWNGCGYPRGLKEESIPIAARIFAVADVFDALCSKRPYKAPMSFEQSMSILINDSGSHFDPAIISAFQKIAQAIYQRLEDITESNAKILLQERVHHYFDT